MEQRTGQRILNTAAGVGIAILLGSGMALAASGVFTVSDYTTTPLTSSPTPDAGASQRVPSSRSAEQHSVSPIPLVTSPVIPTPSAGPPQEPAQQTARPPVPDALVPGEQPGQADGDHSGDPSAKDAEQAGGEDGGGEPGEGKPGGKHPDGRPASEAHGGHGGDAAAPRDYRPGDGCGDKVRDHDGAGNHHYETGNHRRRCE